MARRACGQRVTRRLMHYSIIGVSASFCFSLAGGRAHHQCTALGAAFENNAADCEAIERCGVAGEFARIQFLAIVEALLFYYVKSSPRQRQEEEEGRELTFDTINFYIRVDVIWPA